MEHEEHLKLLVKVATGDKVAFEQLYEATSSQLYAVSLKILIRQELAEDAVQEAFIRIWHNAGEYKSGRGTVLTWMISIVRYRALDILRFHKVRNETDLVEESLMSSENLAATQGQQKKQIELCLDELESKQKQAIHLAFYCGLSHQEVATHVQDPLGSVKSMIRRGMQSLKRCLGL